MALDPNPTDRTETVNADTIHHYSGQCPVSAHAWRPTSTELQDATSRTATALADPGLSPADRARVAELEAALYSQIEPGPCDRVTDPSPQKSRIDWAPELDAEREAGA